MKMKLFGLTVIAASLVGCGGGGSSSGGTGSGGTVASSVASSVTVSSVASSSVASSVASSKATPIPVQKTSYLNAKNLNIDAISLPTIPTDSLTTHEEIQAGYAFGDFAQDGTLSLIAASSLLDNAGLHPSVAGKIRIYSRVNNVWVENTALLKGDTTSCISPRQAIVADFNNDGKPDAFFSCTGDDFSPYAGETSRIVLSQPDGTYTDSPVVGTEYGYTHGATAADIDGDGNIDIIVADGNGFKHNGSTKVYALMGHGDGTFTADYSRITPTGDVGVFEVELFDVDGDGNADLVYGGHEDSALTKLLKNTNGTFLSAATTIPSITGYGEILGFLKIGNWLYVDRTTSSEHGVLIQKVDLATNASTTLYQKDDYSGIGYFSYVHSVTWLTPYNGNIISTDADTPLVIAP